VGLAARAPLTMFDEAYLGMDAPTRRLFQEELLADYVEHPARFRWE
jgi:ABC-2 type transport system ATP-binding protein